MTRYLSHTEVRQALDCEWRWNASYGGHGLPDGAALAPRADRVVMRRGRAWGRGVAAWHRHRAELAAGMRALDHALAEEETRLLGHDRFDAAEHRDTRELLRGALAHYSQTATALDLVDEEVPVDAPVPARTGRRASSRYRFSGYVDGLAAIDGALWLVEFKLRGQLTPPDRFQHPTPQVRRYAWALRRMGTPVVGAIVDERLADHPQPPKINKGNRKPSHDRRQRTTGEWYARACHEADVAVQQETFDALDARRWQQRAHIPIPPEDTALAGAELASAAMLIRDLDTGRRIPLRNPSQLRCPGCPYLSVCDAARGDLAEVAATEYLPRAAKRERTTHHHHEEAA